ncbi:hypothetical protein LTS18_014828, partial [Coniosporium uncinatum]
AQTLKTLLESYLSQPPESMPNLQHDAKRLAENVLKEAAATQGNVSGAVEQGKGDREDATPEMKPMSEPERPTSKRASTAKIVPLTKDPSQPKG